MYRLLAVALCTVAIQAQAQTVSLETLLDEMVSRDGLARLPAPAYTCRQASSYDRDSVKRDGPGWYANWDRSQFVRIEKKAGRTEYVLMDEDGPGAVVRFWATWHGPRGKKFTNGTLRFYLDGNETAAIEGPIASIIDGGGLVGAPLSQGVSPETHYDHRGHNLYLPVPYAKHCKITYETAAPGDRGAKTGEALYYQINYRTYVAGTKVESFSKVRLAAQRPRLAKVQARLTRSGASARNAPGTEAGFNGMLPSGSARSIDIAGPAAVDQLRVRLDAADKAQALRSTILEIEFDGKMTVWCPVGAFFGAGYDSGAHRTWYTDVRAKGTMKCFWTMPFAKSCRITLRNIGKQPVDVELCDARHGAWRWDDRSMHLHATWRQLTEVDTRGGKNMSGGGAFDVNYVEVEGNGVYVGDTLTVFNGSGAWWGEGDEKIFVDGEDFPSHFGTGTEDYYGYAWCKPEFFTAPFHAQPNGSGNLSPGFSVNSRYRALDAIPFVKGIRVDMELWHWAGTKVNYAPATLWYARPGATCNVKPDPKTAALPVARKRSDIIEVFRVKGAIEGEDLAVKKKTGGITEIQNIPQFRWSEDGQVWWRDAKVGDRLVIEFPVAKRGRFEVVANLTKAVDYAIVDVAVDDYPAKRFDRFHTSVTHDKLSLGTFELREGAHRLNVEITGANEKAVKRYMFGLDYLLLVPKP